MYNNKDSMEKQIREIIAEHCGGTHEAKQKATKEILSLFDIRLALPTHDTFLKEQDKRFENYHNANTYLLGWTDCETWLRSIVINKQQQPVKTIGHVSDCKCDDCNLLEKIFKSEA